MNARLKELINTVIKNNYCIGCGICASVPGSPLEMKLDENGKYQSFLVEKSDQEEMKFDVLSVCPFSDASFNETELGEKAFGNIDGIMFNKYTGYYLKNYAGYVKEGDFREKGSSGGMGNWIAAQLLRKDLVDGIIHVKESDDAGSPLFKYQISYNERELTQGAKSKYYPVEMSEVMGFVRKNEGRYAIIGVPCFLKAVRLLVDKDKVIRERIKFFIGLVCGHLKSDMFAKAIAWEMGIEPHNLEGIVFRKKLKDRPASQYGVEVRGKINGKNVILSAPTKDLSTTNWGHGLFKYNACDYCDDVLAETADVTVGDAWLPEYSKDSMGTNIIVVRNPIIEQIIYENRDKLFIEKISVDKVYQSQAGGFRHRREGLSYRLYLKDKNKEWRPNKRVQPSTQLSEKRKKIYEKRMQLVQESFKAFRIAERKNNFNAFIQYMDPIIKNYDKLTKPSFIVRVLRKFKREIKNLLIR